MIDPLLWLDVEIEHTTDNPRLVRGLALVSNRIRELMRDIETMQADEPRPSRDELIVYVIRLRSAVTNHLRAPQWDRERLADARAHLNETVLSEP